MPSCRSAPGSPGTWTASPRCVPPPNAGPGGFSRPIGPISPRQFAGYEAGIRLRRRCGGGGIVIPLPAFLYQNGPDTLQHPTLEGSVDGTVIPQFLGQVVPLAGAAHAEYDPLQHLPLVHPLAPLRLGRVQLQNHRLNSLPQIIWYFPYRWQSLPLSPSFTTTQVSPSFTQPPTCSPSQTNPILR